MTDNTTHKSVDVLVIGGGPAGLGAAIAARDSGARVLIIERNDRTGGVLRQCIHDGFGVIEYGERLTGPEYAQRQVAALDGEPVPVMIGAHLHSLRQDGHGWRAEIITSLGIRSVRAAAVVMATGCRERTDRQIFLHGDRPAGIFTAGQAQRLINIDGVMPGREVVVLGSGDIGLIMARRFVLEGAHVQGVYEIQASPSGLARNVAQCLEDWEIPLHLRTTVTEVHGRDRVEAVTICPVDESGAPDLAAGTVVACDTLILSVGLIPENDIIADMGVRLDGSTGGPAVTQDRETELPGLYVCGNALHVYDLVDYVSECGRAAGAAAARRAAADAATARPHGHASAIPVRTSGIVKHLAPQLLDPTVNSPAVFFLRVAVPADRATLSVSCDGRTVCDRRLTYLRPPEMIRYQLSESAWASVRRRPGRITVAVESANGH
jgi:NADPH-dependent 2,4-dienoyl-CoA reductase/sulfur reductase-like enzyme